MICCSSLQGQQWLCLCAFPVGCLFFLTSNTFLFVTCRYPTLHQYDEVCTAVLQTFPRLRDTDELDCYRSTPVEPDVDALSWWADNRSLFPQTASVAACYLAIPATSVMSERQFSDAGRLITKLRSRLEMDRVDTIMFLYKNM